MNFLRGRVWAVGRTKGTVGALGATDFNPVIADENGASVVDARIVMK